MHWTIERLLQRTRRAFGIKTSLPRVTEDLTKLERIYHFPPFTRKLVAAIKLIAPQYDFSVDEECREFWEAEQNGCCWGEYNALLPLFNSMQKPAKILEIGPGMGRSIVFFGNKLGWNNSDIHAYEGDGSATKYTLLGPRFSDSFCGNIGLLKSILFYNGIHNVTILDAKDMQLSELPGPYDFIYSFYSIGFHWSLEYFLDDLLGLMHDKSLAVFTIPDNFNLFPRLTTIPHRIINWKTVYPKNGTLKIIIIGKISFPNW
jgi:hypothetical protein